METDATLNTIHENFHQAASTLLTGLDPENDVFQELWQRGEYRLAYLYLHDNVIAQGKVQPKETFAELDESFYWHFIENY